MCIVATNAFLSPRNKCFSTYAVEKQAWSREKNAIVRLNETNRSALKLYFIFFFIKGRKNGLRYFD